MKELIEEWEKEVTLLDQPLTKDNALAYFKQYFRIKKYKNIGIIEVIGNEGTDGEFVNVGLEFKTSFVIGKEKIFCKGFAVIFSKDVGLFATYSNKAKTKTTKERWGFNFNILEACLTDEKLGNVIDDEVLYLHFLAYRSMFKFGETI